MKFLIVSVVAAIAFFNVVIAEETDNESVCVAELKKNPLYNDSTSEQKIKCLYLCLSQKEGITDSNGKFNIDEIQKYVGADSITDENKEALKKCEDKNDKVEHCCEKFWETLVCVSDIFFPAEKQKSAKKHH